MASLILKSICKLNPLSRSILWPTAARYLTTEPPTATPPTSQTEKETSKPIAAAAGEDETLNLNEEEFSILSSKTKLKLQALQNEAQIKNHPFNIAKATKMYKTHIFLCDDIYFVRILDLRVKTGSRHRTRSAR